MGLVRKLSSVSTLGGVKYTSKREAQTKAAHAQGKLARQEAKLVKAQLAEQKDALAREHAEACLAGEYPKWKLTMQERVLLSKAQKEG
jgi:hypothetical protein